MEKRSVSAIICELNPLHTGHLRALQAASRGGKAAVVCILSGNFVQRGEPALYSKWLRAEAALRCGADLVIELPTPWAMAGAETFARGGVSLAAALGCTHLVFGSEIGEIEPLYQAAEYLNSDSFSYDLHHAPEHEQTLPFARRRALVLQRALGDAAAVQSPNNTLAVEYCKAILLQKLSLQPVAIPRLGVQHDGEADESTASASALREMIRNGDFEAAAQFMPAATVFRGQPTASVQALEKAVFYCLRTSTAEDFRNVPDVAEGIENRILAAAGEAEHLDELYRLVKSKRYSHARIRRIVLSRFLGIFPPVGLPPYIRVLGMNQTGPALLRRATLPVAARASEFRTMDAACRELFALESRIDDIYALAYEKNGAAGSNQRHGLIRL